MNYDIAVGGMNAAIAATRFLQGKRIRAETVKLEGNEKTGCVYGVRVPYPQKFEILDLLRKNGYLSGEKHEGS